MNSNRLNAAQLLMNFTAHENGKTCQKIHDNDFSRELEAMTQPASGEVKTQARSHVKRSGGISEERIPRSHESRPVEREPIEEEQPRQALEVMDKVSPEPVREPKAKASKLERVKDLPKRAGCASTEDSAQVVVNNPLILDKIMAQLQFKAETRQACKEALSKQGTLSVDAILSFLGQKQVSGQPDGTVPTVSAVDVQELLSSIQMGSSTGTTSFQGLQLKSEGTYTLQELREILQPFKKDAMGKAQRAAASKAQTPLKATDGAELTDATMDATSGIGTAPDGHLENLSNSRIPPFSHARGSRLEAHQSQSAGKAVKDPLSDAMSSAWRSGAPNGKAGLDRQAEPASAWNLKAQSFEIPTQMSPETAAVSPMAGDTQQVSTDFDRILEKRGMGDGALGTTDSQVQPAAGASSRNIDGSEPILGTVARFNAGNDLPDDPSLDNKGVYDASSNLEVDTSIQVGRSFAGAGLNGSENGYSNHPKGNGPRGFTLDRDSTTGVQNSDTNLVFSLSGGSQSSAGPTRLEEGAQKVSVYQPDWAQRVSEQLHDKVRQGKSSLVVELDPENLGHMTLRVEADQKHVTAWVTTQNEDAKNLLLQNTASLQKHLADQGLDLGKFNVNVGGDKGSQQPFSGHRERRQRPKTDGKVGAEIVTGITPRMQVTGSNQMISLIA